MKRMNTLHLLLLLLTVALLPACKEEDKSLKPFSLEGAWVLTQAEYPMGGVERLPQYGSTLLRIYDGDTALYQCRLMHTETALVVRPYEECSIMWVDNGGGDCVYLEDNDPHPLSILNDSTIIIQHNGVLYTWHRDVQLTNEWGLEIRDLAANALKENSDAMDCFVLSSKERVQASTIHWLVWAVIAFIVMVVVVALIAVSNHRAKQRLQLQLQQIREEHDERPQPVRQAIVSMESAFFASDDYVALQRRMASGQLLKEEEWTDIEAQAKKVYPGFTSHLRNLHPMSDLEYQVCLLIKLRIAPTDIAAVLARDVSTISTVRSRLYKKVFGKKGGAKEWDEFLLSIGV